MFSADIGTFSNRPRLNFAVFILAVSTISLVCCQPAAQAQATDRRIIFTGTSSPVPGEHRLALVIGNTHYGGGNELVNPENDANAMAATLQRLGFDVTLILDATRDGLRDAISSFTDNVSRSGNGTVALLYYSGHGMQVDGKNYFIPVGFTPPASRDDIDDYAYPAQRAIDEMQAANAQVNIMILDACRNNPFEGTRAWGGKGLARLEARGLYIAYATAEGATASDNPGAANGLFTQELLKNLGTPGLDIHKVFQYTRASVYELSGHTQYPFDYDGLLDDNFYFNGQEQPEPNPNSPTAMTATQAFDTGTALFGAKEYADAEQNLRDAVRLDPTNAQYQCYLGLDMEWQNKYPDAEPYLREAVRLQPTNASYQDCLGHDLNFQQKYADAEAVQREAVRLDPTNADFQDDLGEDCAAQQNYPDAEACFRLAVQSVPGNATYQNNLGTVLANQKKYVDAEPYYRQAVQIDPTNARYQDDMGNDYYDQQKYTEGEPYLREAVRLDPNNAGYKTDLDNDVKAEGAS